MAFPRPSKRDLAVALKLLAPYRALTRAHVAGIDNVPAARPLLFVGNHSIYGVLDPPLLFAELYERKGIVLFSLGDHAHFRIPVWRDFLARFGTVDGTRENCAQLMQDGEAVLVFPGGGREVAKRKGERYQLIWKDRLGFVRMAAQHGCTIVPFASVGVEDAFEIVLDADELLASPLGKLIDRLGIRRDIIMPLARPKRPGRIYLGFAPPIAATGIDSEDPTALRVLRDQVRSAVEGEIASLRALRATQR